MRHVEMTHEHAAAANPLTAVGTIDVVEPGDKWVFDDAVTNAFDDMLARSIPQYHVMRDAVFECGRGLLTADQTKVVDCGASRGEAIAPFVDLLGARGRFVCVESSDPMARAMQTRFAPEIATGTVLVEHQDLRSYRCETDVDLTLAVLTLQFIPIEHRQAVIQRIYDWTKPGGAIILVEKILGVDATVNSLFVDIYHRFKMANGYSNEAIERKALSLEGVLMPMTAQWNAELLEQAGFRQVDCFWRWMNFAGWVARKPAVRSA